MDSQFYHDGFRDGAKGYPYSPPAIPVYASEYAAGFGDAIHPERNHELTARESSHAA